MALDVVTLQIKVDASQVQEAINRLGNLATAGAQVETGTARATAGVGRLNGALLMLTRQATGTSPAVARLADVIFSMALGGTKTLSVLAFLALLTVAYKKLTEESRRAAEETRRVVDALQKLAGVSGQIDELRVLRAGRRELAVAQTALDAIRSEDVLAPYALRGGPSGASARQAALERQQRRENEALNKVLLLNRSLGAAVAAGVIPEGPPMSAMTSPEEAFRALQQEMERLVYTLQEITPLQLVPTSVQPSGPDMSGISTRLPGIDYGQAMYGRLSDEEMQARRKAMEEQALLDIERLDSLAKEKQAVDALVGSLASIGRAYGGVADQVVNLAAAMIAVHRAGALPMGTTQQRAVGYASAAAGGFGMGISTGNAMMGGVGGGIGGYLMTGGDIGGIVGAVSGIVGGLIEQGRRARLARLQWQAALQGFEDMWDDLTPEEQTARAFQQTFGYTIEQARKDLATLQALSGTVIGALAQKVIKRLQDEIAAYERNLKQAREETKKQTEDAAKAERELYDARFRAMNAPSGFNVDYYGWAAGFGGTTPATPEPTTEVNVFIDGEEVAARLERRQSRTARRGGSQPTLFTTR